ncbi:hypothetical protein Syun_003849 [Stephania yunnanensis]|uniref:Uncharacterized protein n=1 Tax=Stephania yunnanensis TaxID=152371 RepID=A0AAP0L3G9_9MAGN
MNSTALVISKCCMCPIGITYLCSSFLGLTEYRSTVQQGESAIARSTVQQGESSIAR